MSTTENIIEQSYKLQRESLSRASEKELRMQSTWFNEDTVDYWRHNRMINPLLPILQKYKNTNWLTVGDGRFGLDSIKLKKMEPSISILPTDISTELLEQSKQKQFINAYREENAEQLSFSDSSFDFCFCKEAYHHFPRPYVALYEMLRVASRGIILIEPNDRHTKKIPDMVFRTIRNGIKSLLGKKNLHPDTWNFEPRGNFIFSISQREIEKTGIAMQLPVVAFYFFNDYYEEGVEFENATPTSRLFKKIKRKIFLENMKCKFGLQTYSSVIAVLFKQRPDEELISKLKSSGFKIVYLPENKYLKKY